MVPIEIPDAPVGIPDSFAAHVGLQLDLIALAYTTDLTRVFTFMMSRDVTQRVYPEIESRSRITRCRTTAVTRR